MENLKCPLCDKNFSRLQRLESHLKRKVSCQKNTYPQKLPKKISIGSKDIRLGPDVIICQYCKKNFSSKDNLTKHLKEGYCQKKNMVSDCLQAKSHDENDPIQDLKGKIHVMEKQIAELTGKPSTLEKQIEELKKTTNENKT